MAQRKDVEEFVSLVNQMTANREKAAQKRKGKPRAFKDLGERTRLVKIRQWVRDRYLGGNETWPSVKDALVEFGLTEKELDQLMGCTEVLGVNIYYTSYGKGYPRVEVPLSKCGLAVNISQREYDAAGKDSTPWFVKRMQDNG